MRVSVSDAEEAARKALGKAGSAVRSQEAQSRNAKALNDAHRARYGKMHKSSVKDKSILTALGANALSPTPNADRRITGASKGTSQYSAASELPSRKSTSVLVGPEFPHSTSL